MADTVLNTTVFDGAKKLITHYNVVSDSAGSTTKIVDVSELASNNGKTCKTVRLNKVSFNVSAVLLISVSIYFNRSRLLLIFAKIDVESTGSAASVPIILLF